MKLGQIAKRAMIAIEIVAGISNFPDVFRHILFRHPLQEIKLRNGITISSQNKIELWNHFNDIWFHQTYTENGFDIKPGSVVIDVGANIGLFTLFASRHASQVYSFEPYKPIFDCLVENLRQNEVSNVTAYNAALCAVSGTQNLHLDKQATGNSLIKSTPVDGESISVECFTLQEVFDINNIQCCDFLKLDCEGSEFEIIFGTPLDYLDRIQVISMEVHNDVTSYSYKDLQGYLTTHGFIVGIFKQNGNTTILKAKRKRN